MRTQMAPFPALAPRLCENPECRPKAEGGHHTKKVCKLVVATDPRTYQPETPWQRTCCPACRNRLNWLEVRGPKYRAEVAARGGPKKRGRKPKASIDSRARGASTETPTEKPDESVGENPF